MSRQGIIGRARNFAFLGMRDVCTVSRITGTTVDPNTGEETETVEVIYEEGRCRVQQGSIGGNAQAVTAGQDYQLLVPIELQLPIDAPPVEVDDRVEMISSVDDPQLAGQVFYVRDLMAKTDASSRRIGVTRRTT
jgi:hypothetical protein